MKKPDYVSKISFIEKFHKDFEKIVQNYAGDERVYVFIDDIEEDLNFSQIDCIQKKGQLHVGSINGFACSLLGTAKYLDFRSQVLVSHPDRNRQKNETSCLIHRSLVKQL